MLCLVEVAMDSAAFGYSLLASKNCISPSLLTLTLLSFSHVTSEYSGLKVTACFAFPVGVPRDLWESELHPVSQTSQSEFYT